MKRTFYIAGLRPAHSKAANAFLAACDLGIDGAYVAFVESAIVTVTDGCTQDKLDKQPGAIKKAYEEIGCTDVFVWEDERR